MSLSYETLPGDVDHIIADDHAVVDRLFEHLEAGRGDRRTLVDQVIFNLSAHATAEEQVVYPAMTKAGEGDEAEHAREEHTEIKRLLVTLDGSEPGGPEFEQALTELIAETRHHVEEEETESLPELRQRVGAAKMAELGQDFIAAKRKAPSRPHPSAPDSGAASKVAGLATALVDKARDLGSGKIKRLATDASGLLDPQAQALLDAFADLGPLPVETLTPKEARTQPTLTDAAKKLLDDRGESTDPEPVGNVEDRKIPGPAGDIDIRVYTPAGAAPDVALPVLVWVHGGGWVIADLDVYDPSCRGLANKTQAVVVSVEYRHAPEHPYPAAHDDVLAATRWVLANAADLGGDPARVALGGESAGGNMAGSTVYQLKLTGAALPVAQVLVYPVTTGEQYGDSFTDVADGRPLLRPLLSWMAMHTFEGNPDGAKEPRFDLLSIPTADLSGLPPAFLLTTERDVLREQGQEYARHLQAAGVATTHAYVPGMMHEFFGASAVLDKAEEAQQAVAAFLRKAYGTETVA